MGFLFCCHFEEVACYRNAQIEEIQAVALHGGRLYL